MVAVAAQIIRGCCVNTIIVPWHHGTTVPWYHGTMVPWYHGTMVPWYHGTMVPGYYRTIFTKTFHVTSSKKQSPQACRQAGANDTPRRALPTVQNRTPPGKPADKRNPPPRASRRRRRKSTPQGTPADKPNPPPQARYGGGD